MKRAPIDIVVASGNPHKVQEISAIFAQEGLGEWVRFLSLSDVGGPFAEPAETARTFQENARIKALAYAALTHRMVLADDSGLQVDALAGEPGVDSAIWAGKHGTREQRDARNNEKLMAAMRDVKRGDRGARFVCFMCLADAHGKVIAQTRGACEGAIADAPMGGGGFGYDAHFLVGGRNVTSAQLTAEEKHKVSHRGHATRLLANELRAFGGAPTR
ncbi:MAG: RdgB/HAM1 family non-canonical purine NTP pyrophosphatase [Phycisphaerales bacterium]|nr:RdgB/HAM1 family non-canonical purine NTP pyrophosphatase [Phycisphaerales bacterium]